MILKESVLDRQSGRAEESKKLTNEENNTKKGLTFKGFIDSHFHQHFAYNFFVRMSFWQLFLCTCNKKKAAEPTFVQKVCTQNVNEIDCRNLRLFFSLLLMDTQLPSNCHLVGEIKSEAVNYGHFEAFLESAPQLILQLSIVLRSGFISEQF